MMARSTNAPFKGRIQKRKTNHLQIITFGLQRTAGPYKGANDESSGTPRAAANDRWHRHDEFAAGCSEAQGYYFAPPMPLAGYASGFATPSV